MKEWSPARKHSFIVSVLRAGSRRWPPKYECLAHAFTEKKINEKTKRLSKHYRCAKCKKEYPTSSVAVDHIQPVVSVQGFTTWDNFIENLYCPIEGLQVLCDTCHAIKTKKETKQRANKKTNRN